MDRTFTLPEEDWATIDQALQAMPFGKVVGIFQRINAQVAQQMADETAAAVESEPSATMSEQEEPTQ